MKVISVVAEPRSDAVFVASRKSQRLPFWAPTNRSSEGVPDELGYELRPMEVTLDGSYVLVSGEWTVVYDAAMAEGLRP